MASESQTAYERAYSQPGGDDTKQAPHSTDDKTKRHPRWTGQETLVLIQGKKNVEDRAQGTHRSTSAMGTEQLGPKWDSISSYCKQHGANREPVQCRKRWSNLLCDFKKIKAWEMQIKEQVESFWIMEKTFKRERKLPSYFDREVYDVLDGNEKEYALPAIPLTCVPLGMDINNDDEDEVATAEEEEEADILFDSSRSVTAEDGLFSDFEQCEQKKTGQSTEEESTVTESPTKTQAAPMPISGEKHYQPVCHEYSNQGTTKEKHPDSKTWTGSMSQVGQKRRRLSLEEDGDVSFPLLKTSDIEDKNLGEKLIKVVERNSNMVNAQLEANNINSQLERDQRKEQINSLVGAFNKLTDALGRIADKL